MADLSKFGKHATPHSGDSLTQPEHLSECDMNVVFRRMTTQGYVPLIRPVQYGSEDMNLDRITHETNKQKIMSDLKFTFEELKSELKKPDLKFEDFIKSPNKYLKALAPAKQAEQPPAGTSQPVKQADAPQTTV